LIAGLIGLGVLVMRSARFGRDDRDDRDERD
jgi:hypothetical protein